MKIVYNPKEESELIGDMGKALQFMLDYCGYREKCHECDFEKACYKWFKLSEELVSIGGEDYESKH